MCTHECMLGRDDFQKISKQSFGVFVFECRLPKENSLSTCETFTRTPIPPRNTTILTEFLEKGRNKTFPRFSCFFLEQLFLYLIKPSSVTKRNKRAHLGFSPSKGIFCHYTNPGGGYKLFPGPFQSHPQCFSW